MSPAHTTSFLTNKNNWELKTHATYVFFLLHGIYRNTQRRCYSKVVELFIFTGETSWHPNSERKGRRRGAISTRSGVTQTNDKREHMCSHYNRTSKGEHKTHLDVICVSEEYLRSFMKTVQIDFSPWSVRKDEYLCYRRTIWNFVKERTFRGDTV